MRQANVAQVVEQLTRNEQACGSRPHIGSSLKNIEYNKERIKIVSATGKEFIIILPLFAQEAF